MERHEAGPGPVEVLVDDPVDTDMEEEEIESLYSEEEEKEVCIIF
jgi:hypothetical protein